MATNTYVALDKATVATATPSITFSSIPSTYTDLVIVMSPATTHTFATFPYVRFNGDSGSNYSYTEVNGSGTSPTSARDVNQTIGWTSPQMGSISNTLGDNTTIVNIMNYSNSATHKTYLSRANRAGSTLDYQGVELAVGLWRNTAAITSVTIGNRRGGVDYNFAVGSTFSLYGIRAEGVSPTTKATGGAVYSDANYYYHVFGASGTFTPTQSISADILVVAGGGAGGSEIGGGGGAGGLLAFTSQSLTATNYTCTVGAGAGRSSGTASGGNGTNSTFQGLTAAVGGGGGGYYAVNGISGGSGGGGGRNGSGAAGTAGQGFAGGTGTHPGGTGGYAGGGGGAGAVGQNGQYNGTIGTGGAGGVGATSSFINAIGSATGAGQTVSNTTYFAGGGGGGAENNGTGLASGGLGGGGVGAYNPITAAGVNALVNTGGGGGAGGGTGGATGGAGGSGIIIVRYAKV